MFIRHLHQSNESPDLNCWVELRFVSLSLCVSECGEDPDIRKQSSDIGRLLNTTTKLERKPWFFYLLFIWLYFMVFLPISFLFVGFPLQRTNTLLAPPSLNTRTQERCPQTARGWSKPSYISYSQRAIAADYDGQLHRAMQLYFRHHNGSCLNFAKKTKNTKIKQNTINYLFRSTTQILYKNTIQFYKGNIYIFSYVSKHFVYYAEYLQVKFIDYRHNINLLVNTLHIEFVLFCLHICTKHMAWFHCKPHERSSQNKIQYLCSNNTNSQLILRIFEAFDVVGFRGYG